MITEPPLLGQPAPRRGHRHGRRHHRRERRHGRRRRRRGDRRRDEGRARPLRAREVHALEPGHAHPPEADGAPGRQGQGGRRPRGRQLDLRGRARARQEPARRLHAVRGLQLRGRDRDLGAAREGGGLSSIHIHEYEIDARSTKLGDEEIMRDIPNRLEESLKGPRRPRRRPHRRRGRPATSSWARWTPKGETELTAEEKLIRAIFKEKAREVRDTSLKVPHGEGGKVIDVKTFSRDGGDDLSPGVNELVRVYVAKKPKDRRGRQARRPPRRTRASSPASSPRRTCRSSRTARRSTSS